MVAFAQARSTAVVYEPLEKEADVRRGSEPLNEVEEVPSWTRGSPGLGQSGTNYLLKLGADAQTFSVNDGR